MPLPRSSSHLALTPQINPIQTIDTEWTQWLSKQSIAFCLFPLNCEPAIKLSKWIDESNKCNLWQRHRTIWNVINRKWLTAILTREMIESKLVTNRQMSWDKSSGKYIGWKILDNKSIINMNHSFQSLFHCTVLFWSISSLQGLKPLHYARTHTGFKLKVE